MFVCSLLLFGLSALSAQSLSLPHDDFGSSFGLVSPNYAYDGTYESIRDVDFKNFRLRIFNERGKPGWRFTLQKGKFEGVIYQCYEKVELGAVHYLDSEGETQRALILFDWFSACGSSGRSGYAQVFELAGGRLTVTQQIDFDMHVNTPGPFVSFDTKIKQLTTTSAHYMPGDAHCCVSAVDVVTYQWDGKRFVRQRIRMMLTEHGRRKASEAPPPKGTPR